MYLISKRQPEKYDKFNEVLLSTINDYLNLYDKYVLKISDNRSEIANTMKHKIDMANTSNKYISIET
jgi:5-bromo-4-chloroindolyl phosphate hydrolysis protein